MHGQHYGGAPGRRAPAVQLRGGLYMALYLISAIAIYGIAILVSNPATTEAIAALPVPMLISGITMMVFLYKMWSAIDDGVTRPSPGAAIGCLFIPLFSIYWVFVVWPGYASQYNAYAQRHGLRVPQLSMGLILCTILLGWVPIVGFILMCVNISRISAAVNALAANNLPAARIV